MKVKVNYSETLDTDELLITCHPNHPNMDEILRFIHNYEQSEFHSVKDHKGNMVYLKSEDIYSFRIENKVLKAYTLNGAYTYNQRLYKVKQSLNKHFLQVSKSEIINILFIDYLKQNKNGIIEIIFTNKDSTYSSRRFLNSIKEALEI